MAIPGTISAQPLMARTPHVEAAPYAEAHKWNGHVQQVILLYEMFCQSAGILVTHADS